MKNATLFMVSTPLHFLVASSIALKNRDAYESHLLFIDQRVVEDNVYLDCEQHWPATPFVSREVLGGVYHLGILKKLRKRQLLFSSIAAIIKQISPAAIFVGNDRRIEFQFAMQEARKIQPVRGCYMDEGTFTYIGRKDSVSFKDRIVDNYLKKLAYGGWWKNPVTIGGSGWIEEAYVAFPELVHPLLRSKNLKKMDSSYFSDKDFVDLSGIILGHFAIDLDRLSKLKAMITLPHESVMARVGNYGSCINDAVQDLSNKGIHVGIKYHPRNSGPDVLGLGELPGVWLIPDGAAFECFLPLLRDCVVVGDMSSTLLTTRWLRPDLQVIAISNEQSSYFSQFSSLFEALTISVVPVTQLGERISGL